MLASDEDQGESGEEEQDVAKEGIFRSWLDASVTLPFVAPEVDQFVDRFVKDNSFALLRSKLGNVLQHHETISVGSCCTG
ncbi:unnamed protein product, partial [Durusdinium trenchii]